MAEWAIVLAGGEGKRMRHWIRDQFGHAYPKQYCKFYGNRTMLEHTIDRACQLVEPEHVVTVIRKRHRVFLGPDRLPGTILEQPVSRDTGPGLLLPAAHILARDPDALIHVFPADHFISPDDLFNLQMRRAAEIVRANPDYLVLLGAQPNRPESDYGWIQPGEPLDGWSELVEDVPRKVLTFCEKPTQEMAELLYARHCLWNTLIISCRIRKLWSLASVYMPEVHRLFELFVKQLPFLSGCPAAYQCQALLNLYALLPRTNLSYALLNRAARHCLVMPLTGILWSDWGRPERVNQFLGGARSCVGGQLELST